MPSPRPSRQRARDQRLASWIFGSLLLAFVIGETLFGPDSLPPFKQRLVGFISAVVAGALAYLFTGELGIQLGWLSARFGQVAVKGAGGLAAFVLVLVWWQSPLAPVAADTGIYRVRVAVLGPDGLPTDDAQVTSDRGGEWKRVAGGWQLDIPAGSDQPGKRLTVYAKDPAAFLAGRATLELGDDREPTVTVRLAADRSARIHGMVLGEGGQALADARVWVVGQAGEPATTGLDGGFELAAHAAEGQQVLLHVERAGYAPLERYHPAGEHPATLVLERN